MGVHASLSFKRGLADAVPDFAPNEYNGLPVALTIDKQDMTKN
jgi:hypothetical protein